MIRKKRTFMILAALAPVLLLTLSGCGRSSAASEPAGPVTDTDPVIVIEAAEQSVPEVGSGRQDGERFEEVILLEGMEETVHYEHVRNEAIGFEMDYDYTLFERRSGSDRERFVSIWDNPENPENYLEVIYRAEDAESAAASVRAALSQEYELLESSRELEGAGSCIRIEASELKGTGRMADQLQAVYIIPASDGCRVAAAHYAIEAAEGFGRRFSYMLNTLAVIGRSGEGKLSDEQALSAVKRYCYIRNPDLENMANAGEYPVYWDVSSSSAAEIVILFRSYTGAQIRYYIDAVSGETYVTEFVPGISSEETRTDERFNVRDYLSGGDASSNKSLSATGTWQTASMGYEADGTMHPEYYVQFTDSEIRYGHLKDGAFVLDHTDRIVSLEGTAAGGSRIRAEASNGAQYTYQTCESDENVLEYFETWREEDFPEMYRGGASLSRCG